MQSDIRNVANAVEKFQLNRAHWRVFAAVFMTDASVAALVESPIYLRLDLQRSLAIDDASRALLVFVAFIGIALGGLCYSAINASVGRRTMLLTGLLPGSLLISFQVFARNFRQFLFIRGMAGFFIGLAVGGAGVYLSEFLPTSHRGRLMFAFRLSYSCTALVMVTLSGHLEMQTFLSITGVPAAIAFGILLFLPESPRFLASRGRTEEVHDVLAWLSGGADLAPLHNPQEDGLVVYGNASENPEGYSSASPSHSPPPRPDPVAAGGFVANVLRVSIPWIFLATASGGLRYLLPVHISPKDDPVKLIMACTALDMTGNLLGTALADMVGRCTMFVCGSLVAAISSLGVLATSSLPSQIVLAALQQGSQALPWLAILTLSCELFPTEQRGAAAAGTRAVELFFLATSPLFAGQAAADGKADLAIVIYAVIYALGALIAWILLRDVPTLVGRPMVESAKED